jgi:hypothetical protein
MSNDPTGEAVLDQETARFLDTALQKKADLAALLKSPKRTAKELGLEISENVAAGLKRLRARPGKIDEADQEALQVFNQVVTDGRYVYEFLVAPGDVTRKLGIKASRAALKRLKDYRLPDLVTQVGPGGAVSLNPGPIIAGVVVAAIIVLWSHDPRRVVIDESGRVKL